MVHVIDLNFQGISQNIAAFLVETDAGPILVETGPHSTLPSLQKGVEMAGYRLEDIQHVFLTHIHLDHAGAAWWFARNGANIYVHPRGSKHLAAPERLMDSARRIYQDKMDELWGEMHQINPALIVEAEHEAAYQIGQKTIRAWHTPGHAVHHIAWQIGPNLFTGDVAGVSINQGVVIPPCPPPDINIEDWEASLDLLKKIKPERFCLTHFGPVTYSEEHLESLRSRLHKWADWIKPYYQEGKSVEEITPLFQAMVKNDLETSGVNSTDMAKYEAANPSWMSVAGLLRYWKKRKPK